MSKDGADPYLHKWHMKRGLHIEHCSLIERTVAAQDSLPRLGMRKLARPKAAKEVLFCGREGLLSFDVERAVVLHDALRRAQTGTQRVATPSLHKVSSYDRVFTCSGKI